jgi:signal transduction histidine kinase
MRAGLSETQVRQIAEFVRKANKAVSEKAIVRASLRAMHTVTGIRRMRLVYASGAFWKEWNATTNSVQEHSHHEWPQPDRKSLTVYFQSKRSESGYVSVEKNDSARLPLEMLTPGLSSALMLRVYLNRMQAVSLAETELIRATLRARDEERRHIARELHDDFGQLLTSLKVGLRWAEDRLRSVQDADEVADLLSIARDDLGTMLSKIRDLSHTLYPRILDTLGFAAALKELSYQVSQHTKLDVDCIVRGKERRLSKEVGVALYRSCQEAVSNAIRHAEATHLSIRIKFGRNQVQVSIEDDGRGFNPQLIYGSNARLMTSGFWTIRQRMTDIGGAFRISTAQGRGTVVEMTANDSLKGPHARRKNKTSHR